MHVTKDSLGISDAPSLVEGRLEYHATKGQLAGGKAAARLEDIGRDLSEVSLARS